MIPSAIAATHEEKATRRSRAMMAIGLAFTFALPAHAATPWALFDRSCPRGTSELEVPCGDLGVFHFADIVDPPGCTALQTGVDDNTNYPIPRQGLEAFTDIGQITPRAGLTHVGKGRHPNPENPWMAIIDFDSEHGESTQWLADYVAGESAFAESLFLDDPTLLALGETVTDLHVLATACRIAEAVDVQGRRPPTSINMSFGRSPNPTDARSAANCARNRASCQVAQVVSHLRDLGSLIVAAAGNHKTFMFPAQLEEVIDAAMLDLTLFLDDEAMAAPAWESPSPASAHLPGNALCLRGGWPAPAGSSYSSALLAGWIGGLVARNTDIDLDGSAPFEPRYDTDHACYVLARGEQTYGGCNFAVGQLLEGVEQGDQGRCWQGSRPNTVSANTPDQPHGPLAISPFDQWVAGNGPLPASDPCVPCVGNLFGVQGQEGLKINMSQSGVIAEELTLDALYLRVDQIFYPLPFGDTELGWIADGLVSELTLNGFGTVAGNAKSSSLVFVLRTENQSSCAAPPTPGCLWTSTAIYLANAGE